jgi:two-component system CitB family sensor kinase
MHFRTNGRGLRGVLVRPTLAGQFLALQVTVLLVALAVASVVSLRQGEADFRDERSAPLRAAAQDLANLEVVRAQTVTRPVPASMSSYAQLFQDRVDATSVLVADLEGTVLYGARPGDAGEEIPLRTDPDQRVRTWTGDLDVDGVHSIAVQVPLFAPDRKQRLPEQIGVVMVTEAYPSLADRAEELLPDLLTFLGIGLGLGLLGAWLLARLIKRRTRGLEPAEIAALADQREALLHSIREGVVAVATDGTVTVLSDSARELVGLPESAVGRRVDELDLDPALRGELLGDDEVQDRVVVLAGRVVVLNRNRVVNHGRQVGTVTTLRDRTELMAMQSELTARESITETLRAQTHEFNNQLHTISGLVQLEEYDEVSRLIGALTRRRAEINEAVTKQVQDPAVAALLIAKVSLAAERRVEIVLAGGDPLPRLDPELSADVGTVLGNLVDNALDATVAAGGERIDVRVAMDGDQVVVRVADSGPGVPDGSAKEVFRRGFTTKPGDASGRGVGLALVQVVCERRGGSVTVHNDAGAVFTAVLPVQGGGAR